MKETVEEISVGAAIVATGHKEFDGPAQGPAGLRPVRERAHPEPTGAACWPQPARPGRGAPAVRRRGAPQDFHAPVRGIAGLPPPRATSTVPPICCLFATLHASLIRQHHPDDGGHDRLHRRAHAGQIARGVLPAGAEPRRALRARPRERVVEEPDKRLRVRFEDTFEGTPRMRSCSTWSCSRPGLEARTARGDRPGGRAADDRGRTSQGVPPQARARRHPSSRHVRVRHGARPKNIPDSIAQAKAAAARAVAMLSTGYVLTSAHVASCDEGCASGVASANPFARKRPSRSPRVTPHRSVVDPNACRGCGICAADCPTGAMQLGGFSDDEIMAEVCA